MSKPRALSAESGLNLRYANSKDNLLILDWRNNTDVRKYSRSREIIEQDIHDKWFTIRLANMHLEPILIFSFQGKDFGMTRLDKASDSSSTFEISILVDPDFQGRGFARMMISQTLLLAQDSLAATELVANIHRENLSSIGLFTNLDFHKTQNVKGQFEEFRIYL